MCEQRMFALLHQPTPRHGRGVFLEPLVEQGIDLLTEIGGMAQARRFVGLQRVARSGQQKLPGRLRFVRRRADLSAGDNEEKCQNDERK
jgi:hypothetical protein